MELDKRVRELKTITQSKTAEKNKITREIPTATDKAPLIARSKEINAEIAADMAELAEKEEKLSELLHCVPQIPSGDTPIGSDDTENVEVRRVGTPREFDFTPRPQWDLLEMNGWWKPEKIASICGTRTYALFGEAAEQELAIQTYVIQKLISKGFTFVNCPSITKPQTIFNAGYSPCFRKEAGAAGRDTRGIVRIHQFNKVEQYIYCTPEQSDEMHEHLLNNLCEVMEDLELPYRVIMACTGDMGFNKVKMHDVEAWFPSENTYRELGSCSSIGQYQARRTNTRFRASDGTMQFCATLNNTGIALPRAIVPVIENHQNPDGSVNIPKALQPLMGGRTKIGGKHQ